jgi:diguanylate cyclase (GGDEF)-like protein
MQSAKLDLGARPKPDLRLRIAVNTPEVDRLVAEARQAYFDALPIAAGVVQSGPDGLRVCVENPTFAALSRGSEPHFGRGSATSPLLADDAIGPAVQHFLRSGDDRCSFQWSDGRAVAARHFTVGLSRLVPTPNEPQRCLMSLVDRTAEVESNRTLRSELLHDSLTGLPNRVAFDEQVEEAGSAKGAATAVLVIDVKRFSRINESLGAIAADELLITVARRLLSTLRSGDRLARIGGNEFAILLHLGEGMREALIAAERLRGALAAPVRLSELEIQIDCAIGCAVVGPGKEADEAVRNAQLALKRAKLSGRIEVYRPDEAVSARRRFSIETELRRAIEADALTLAYQPLIDLATGTVKGFEALARWDHADRGQIAPAEFIQVAEECGLIVPLGRWALDTAIRTLAGWDVDAGFALPIHVAVNMSAIQVARDDVAGMVASALRSHRIAGHRLTLELTESAIFPDPGRATTVIEAVKALDVRIAMDDFGTGYSNLGHLQKLPIDVLKIDRSFVTDMLQDRDAVAIVRAVLSLAHALGMTTTAEGVETIELAQTLNALGCTQGQGFYFGRPLPAREAFDYWRSRST